MLGPTAYLRYMAIVYKPAPKFTVANQLHWSLHYQVCIFELNLPSPPKKKGIQKKKRSKTFDDHYLYVLKLIKYYAMKAYGGVDV
jgi:hypothetical protein